MNCSQAKSHLEVFADGELTGNLQQAVDAHVSTCTTCGDVVGRLQALRRCARRSLEGVAIPAGLADRVVAGLGGARRKAQYRTRALVPLAMAAAVLLGVFLWTNPSGTTDTSPPLIALTVTPADFARIYRNCALDYNHDSEEAKGQCPESTRERLSKTLAFRPLMPDLSNRHFRLAGACRCAPMRDAGALHAYYTTDDPTPTTISFFTLDQPVRLVGGVPMLAERRLRRSYVQGADDCVNVVTWGEGGASYAVCGLLSAPELCDLAESVNVARLLARGRSLASVPLP